MNYYLDQEFIERFHKPLFGKPRHVIDLISIGLVAEDGRTYYAISNEYGYNDASDWVKENVILPAYIDAVHGDARNHYTVKDFHKHFGKSNKQIAKEVTEFCKPNYTRAVKAGIDAIIGNIDPDIQFYGYYADYDWVLFCSLFGTMMELPKGFPMYCKDLQQILDEKAESKKLEWGSNAKDFDMENHIKTLPGYPAQSNEHNALSDAKWNKELYHFLQKI
jgi:hypothetical protein